MSKDNNNYHFPYLKNILSSLQRSGFSVIMDDYQISGMDSGGKAFFIDYSEEYLRLIMKENDIYSLYGIANILKNMVDVPIIQYSIIYQDKIGTPYPALEWRFDDQAQYLTRIINHPVLDENRVCSYIKLLNGKEIGDYQKEKIFLKK